MSPDTQTCIHITDHVKYPRYFYLIFLSAIKEVLTASPVKNPVRVLVNKLKNHSQESELHLRLI
jgi:hypothetical protein